MCPRTGICGHKSSLIGDTLSWRMAPLHSQRLNIWFERSLWHFDDVRPAHIRLIRTSHVRGTEVSTRSSRIISIQFTYSRPISLKCLECNPYNYMFQIVTFLGNFYKFMHFLLPPEWCHASLLPIISFQFCYSNSMSSWPIVYINHRVFHHVISKISLCVPLLGGHIYLFRPTYLQILLINPLRTKSDLTYIWSFSSYHAVNTYRLGYKNQLVSSV
jgi:hypothetical protein